MGNPRLMPIRIEDTRMKKTFLLIAVALAAASSFALPRKAVEITASGTMLVLQ